MEYNSLVGSDQILFWFDKLKKKFPSIEGSVVSPSLPYQSSCRQYSDIFVYILHVHGNHWICVSNFGCEDFEINVYDSAESIDYDNIDSIKEQLFSIKKDLKTVNIQPVQKQNNSFDCGTFSLAFATSIFYLVNPTHCWYDDKKLRDHFNRCVRNDEVKEFPTQVSKNEHVCKDK